MENCDGIILPGGESTAMAIIAKKWDLFTPLRNWVKEGKPIWGTCAGMILLSDHAVKQCEGGQELIGGLDAKVCRNFFGSQVQSDEYELTGNLSLDDFDMTKEKFTAVFIRAPAILTVGTNVNVLATIKVNNLFFLFTAVYFSFSEHPILTCLKYSANE